MSTQMKVGNIGSKQNLGDLGLPRAYVKYTLNVGNLHQNSLSEISVRDSSTGVSSGNYSQPFEEDLSRVRKRIERAHTFSELVNQLRQLHDGWDGANAVAPSSVAISNTSKLIDPFRVSNFFPYKVAASVEGGVGLSFSGTSGMGYIECTNDGQVLAACYGPEIETQAWEFDISATSVKEALEKVKQYIGV